MVTLEELRRIDPHLYVISIEELDRIIGEPGELTRILAQTLRLARDLLRVRARPIGGFPVTMKPEYGMRRGWNTWMAVREFIQNALDAKKEFYEVVRWFENLYIIDDGPGIKPSSALLIGASGKECWQRGIFGEGLKIAASHLEATGKPVLIATNLGGVAHLIYRMALTRGGKLIFLILEGEGYPRIVRTRNYTVVAIANAGDDYEADLRAYDLPDPSLAVFDPIRLKGMGHIVFAIAMTPPPSCPKAMNEYLVIPRDPSISGILWVRDIFVNYMQKFITEKPLFAYNLWWVDLDPNRTTVRSDSVGNMYRRIEQLLKSAINNGYPVADILSEHIDIEEYTVAGVLTVISVDTKRLENILEYKLLDTDYRALVILNAMRRAGKTFTYVSGPTTPDYLVYAAHTLGGGIVLLVKESAYLATRISDFTRKELLVDAVNEKARRDLSMQEIDLNKYPFLKNVAEALSEYAATLLFEMMIYEKPRVAPIAKGRSAYGENTIYLNVANYLREYPNIRDSTALNLLSTFYHELAHHIAYHKYSMAEDLTEQYVASLQALASVAATKYGKLSRDILSYITNKVRYRFHDSEAVIDIFGEFTFAYLTNIPIDHMSEAGVGFLVEYSSVLTLLVANDIYNLMKRTLSEIEYEIELIRYHGYVWTSDLSFGPVEIDPAKLAYLLVLANLRPNLISRVPSSLLSAARYTIILAERGSEKLGIRLDDILDREVAIAVRKLRELLG